MDRRIKNQKTFDSDVEWVCLMNNKIVINDFMKNILYNTIYSFGGALIIGNNLNTLLDSETNDLCDSKLKRKQSQRKKSLQQVYTTLKQYFHFNKIIDNTIFLFGIVPDQDDEKYLDIHWNACIVKTNEVIWFDPATSKQNKELEIDINIYESLKTFFTTERKIRNVYCTYSPQQLEISNNDIFCQTWVMMFVDFYIHNKFNTFEHYNFITNGNIPLRKWCYEKCMKMEEYKNYPYMDRYKWFFIK